MESERIKCYEEAVRGYEQAAALMEADRVVHMRRSEKAVKQLASARQDIHRLYQAAFQKDKDKCSSDLLLDELGLASLEDNACEYFARIAAEALSHINETRTSLKRAQLRHEALEAQLSDAEDMRLQAERHKHEIGVHETRCPHLPSTEAKHALELQHVLALTKECGRHRCQALLRQLEAAGKQQSMLKEQLEASQTELTSYTLNLTRTRSHKEELPDSISELATLRAAADAAATRIALSESELAELRAEGELRKKELERGEQARTDLRVAVGLMNLEVQRLREDNEGLSKVRTRHDCCGG